MTITELKTSIDACFIGCTESREDKAKAIHRCFDLFDSWRDEEARAFVAALEADPDFDLSPAAFSTTRNRLNQVA